MSTQVKLKTSMGDIVIELNAEKAPKTVENFLKYVDSDFYNGTIFHRVINGFMVQGGGMDSNMKEKNTQPPIENEANNGLKNDAYTVAMARTNDINSATSQFFINVSNNDFLNFSSETPQGYGYCVFGKVVEGEPVVDQMKNVPTGTSGFHQDVPDETLTIESASRI
ncbi:peptidylprolyl isomerase [Burkholderiales bacterium]|nr:peptidylprolyl isomerase [Burkholderiales bacterium]